LSISPDKITPQEVAAYQHELSYAAGFFDGEGSVSIAKRGEYKGRQGYELVAQITNTYRDVLVMLQARFSGRIYTKNQSHSFGTKPCYWLRWTGPDAADFLREIYPYLVVKKGKAEVGLRFQATMQRTGIREKEDIYEARKNMRAEMKEA
jgi:hypothetical protein